MVSEECVVGGGRLEVGGGWWDGVEVAEGSGEEDEEKGGLAWSLTRLRVGV